MTDVDMELDAARPMGLDGQVDDDLIDYDSDDDNQVTGTTWKTNNNTTSIDDDDLLNLDEDEDMQMHSHDQVDTNSSHSRHMTGDRTSQDIDNEFALIDPDDIPENDTLMSSTQTVDFQTDELGTPITEQVEAHGEVESVTSEQKDANVNGDVVPSGSQIEDDTFNEIDYDDDEEVTIVASANGIATTSSQAEPAVEEVEAPEHTVAPVEDQTSETTKNDGLSPTPENAQSRHDSPKHDHATNEPLINEDEHEIPWEDNGGELARSASEENPQVPDHTPQALLTNAIFIPDHPSEVADHQDEGEAAYATTQLVEEHGERSHNDDTHNVAENDGSAVSQEDLEYTDAQDDHPVAHHTSWNHQDPDYPAITVQYKGEDCPLFSQSSDGFFSDISVLDHSLETVLSNLRAELVNELSEEDELVFQVDELGLEFCESSPRDSLTSVTLRQILDVFDVLVQNQDAGATRTLYAYLFARPNTLKRFEFLSFGAANGKGLDEVIHLFQNPTANGTNPSQDLKEDEGHYDQDEFDGAAEENTANLQEYDEDLTETLAVHADDATATPYASQTEQFDQESHGLTPSAAEALELVAAGDYDAPTASSDLNAHKPNPTIDFAFSEVAGGVEFDEDNIDFTLGALPAVANDGPDDPFVDTPAASSNINHANHDDSDAPQNENNLGVAQADGPAPVANDDDLLDDNDWRDPPSQGEPASTPPSATKRSRPEDETDVVEEQDAKRLRS